MKNKTIYRCSECGNESIKWMGQCIECQSWNTFEEVTITSRKKSGMNKGTGSSERKVPIKLSEVKSSDKERIITSMNEFNRVLGGGIVKDSVTIITAKPGAGKSTLLLEVADDVAMKGFKVLYASGEESYSQIKNRANRILTSTQNNLWILSDTSMDNILDAIRNLDPDLIIVDSIQTFALSEFDSRPGSPTQTLECANSLVHVAKSEKKPRAIMMVGHMTKNNEMAGLRTLEHLVDTVLYLEGESEEELRILSATKNRFGRTGELGIFSIEEEGMIAIDNPSEFFITKRDDGNLVPGSALSVIKEGSRSIIVEIESLVSKSFTPYPSRLGECLRRDQLNTLISILEQRGGIGLYDKNVVIKTTGGLKLKEQAVNLAIIMSIVSSVHNKGIPNSTVFIAEVGLTGELKKVPSIDLRINELDRIGFKKVYVAKGAVKDIAKYNNIEIVELKNLQDVISHVFASKRTS